MLITAIPYILKLSLSLSKFQPQLDGYELTVNYNADDLDE